MEFDFPIIEEMVEYVSEIVCEMSRIFNIPLADALALVNRHWSSFSIGDDNLLGHEEPEYWARTIYEQYGNGRNP